MAVRFTDPSFRTRPRGRWMVRLLCLLLCLAIVAVPGCRGCRGEKTPEEIAKEEEEKRRKEEEEKKKRPFDVSRLVPRPHELKPDYAWFKPGHWTSATLRAKTNQFTLYGDLDSEVLDRRGNPMGLEGMPFTFSSSRKVALPEKQDKYFETLFLAPHTEDQPQVNVRIQGAASRGRYENGEFLFPMKTYQYVFAVVAAAPGDYNYVKTLDSVKYPKDLADDLTSRGYYHVRLVEANRQTPLPSHALYWTSIAYVLLGEFESEALRHAHQEALVDWVHWGGQLIVSGPEALEPLRHTLLAPYLPATRKDARELTAEDLGKLNQFWTRDSGRPLIPVQPWAGVTLEKHPEARYVPRTGQLLVERRVGRGRIVISAFRLSQRELVNWPSLDEFYNACLLNRPSRRFDNDDGLVKVAWADNRHSFDPRLLTQVRYFTRDSSREFKDFYQPPDDTLGNPFGAPYQPQAVQTDWTEGTDVASWNAFSPVANAARATLSAAAAIEIPDRRFVVWVIGGYLMILVPANWLVCRTIGRVELAWVAAPILAVLWTALVIHLARLDIGFARSGTEISVVELQGGYPRAHVSRYFALYTSLTTDYKLESEDPGALMLPFPEAEGVDEHRFGLSQLRFRYGKNTNLEGLAVRSNSTGFAHSEQMLDVGGAIRLEVGSDGQVAVVNTTELTLHGARVVAKDLEGQLRQARIDTLEPGQSASIKYSAADDANAGRVSGRPSGASLLGELNLDELVDLAQSADDLSPGEERLVAWSVDPIPGMTVKPVASQVRQAGLVVAHLRFGFGRDPQADGRPRWQVDRSVLKVLTPKGVRSDLGPEGSADQPADKSM